MAAVDVGAVRGGQRETTIIQLSETTAATRARPQPTLTDAGASRPGGSQQVAEPRAGRTSQASTILAWKARPTQSAGQQQAALAAAVPVRRHRVGRQEQQQDHQGVGDVAPVERDRGRERAARTAAASMPGTAAREPAHDAVEDEHGRHALRRPGERRAPRRGGRRRGPTSACTQKAPGSLSRLTVPAGSKAAKKKLCQLIDMLRTAAA